MEIQKTMVDALIDQVSIKLQDFPTLGKSEEEIMSERQIMVDYVSNLFGSDYPEIVNSIVDHVDKRCLIALEA